MLTEFESGMIAGGVTAIVSFVVVFFFLNSRGAFDALKDDDRKKKERSGSRRYVENGIAL